MSNPTNNNCPNRCGCEGDCTPTLCTYPFAYTNPTELNTPWIGYQIIVIRLSASWIGGCDEEDATEEAQNLADYLNTTDDLGTLLCSPFTSIGRYFLLRCTSTNYSGDTLTFERIDTSDGTTLEVEVSTAIGGLNVESVTGVSPVSNVRTIEFLRLVQGDKVIEMDRNSATGRLKRTDNDNVPFCLGVSRWSTFLANHLFPDSYDIGSSQVSVSFSGATGGSCCDTGYNRTWNMPFAGSGPRCAGPCEAFEVDGYVGAFNWLFGGVGNSGHLHTSVVPVSSAAPFSDAEWNNWPADCTTGHPSPSQFGNCQSPVNGLFSYTPAGASNDCGFAHTLAVETAWDTPLSGTILSSWPTVSDFVVTRGSTPAQVFNHCGSCLPATMASFSGP